MPNVLKSYPLILWNYFKYDGPRTNNHVEGFHTRLMKKAGKSHPNLFEVVQLFIHEEASSNVQVLQLESGQSAPRRRRRYDDIDNRLERLGLEYMLCERSLASYLGAIGHMMDSVYRR
ncbi:uncharacterized protein [Haliotis asinina]|uniref:uncharacterized protein n=1 Tax=Haliotis asinina TaxID=109174 RepID=UPI0035326121